MACNGCLIGGNCVAQGTASAGNACQICDTAQSRTAFSPSRSPACLKADGEECAGNNECQNNQCVLHYGDGDNDDYAPAEALNTGVLFCTSGNAPKIMGFTKRRPTVRTETDCLDSNAQVSPAQQAFFAQGVLGLTPAFDYNCDGIESDGFDNRISNCNDTAIAVCEDRGGWSGTLPPCGMQDTGIGAVQPCQADGTICALAAGGPANRSCH